MFYKALGFAVWKLAMAELRRRYGRQARRRCRRGIVRGAVGPRRRPILRHALRRDE